MMMRETIWDLGDEYTLETLNSARWVWESD